jgi:hypothetical protein
MRDRAMSSGATVQQEKTTCAPPIGYEPVKNALNWSALDRLFFYFSHAMTSTITFGNGQLLPSLLTML